MLLVIPHNSIDFWYISFGEKTTNAIIEAGNYYSVLYITPDMSISVIHIGFTLKNITMISHFNKYRCSYNETSDANHTIINNLINIERGILTRFNTKKRAVFRMPKVKEMSTMNCFVNMVGIDPSISVSALGPELNIIMKVSGVWETEDEYGLIFKFFVPGKMNMRSLGDI
jgi:hypothetical protein